METECKKLILFLFFLPLFCTVFTQKKMNRIAIDFTLLV